MHDHFHYFWVIFPLMWLTFFSVRTWLRWRSEKAWLEIVRGYAERGQTPPAELVAMAGPYGRGRWF